jgi:hypothetical protein
MIGDEQGTIERLDPYWVSLARANDTSVEIESTPQREADEIMKNIPDAFSSAHKEDVWISVNASLLTK